MLGAAHDSQTEPPNEPVLSEAVKAIIDEKVSDGDLSKEDVEAIVAVAQREADMALTRKQQDLILKETKARLDAAQAGKAVPMPLKIYGGLLVALGVLAILTIVFAVLAIAGIVQSGELEQAWQSMAAENAASESGRTITALVLEIILALAAFASGVMSFVLGIRLVRNKRRGAAQTMLALIVLSVVTLVATVMTSGIGVELIGPGITLGFQIVVLVYLDPSLARERTLRRKLMIADDQVRAEEGTLGIDVTERGYITLDFFNIFWIFVIGCLVGDLLEVVWHATVVVPGEIQNRTGMLFGPFSPIYGFGGVLMTIALNRFHNSPFVVTFIVSGLIGAAFEYFVSWFLEIAFGVVAWDYSGTFLNINGRTNFFFMCMWGIIGTIWVKDALAIVLRVINKIPWKLRYSVTAACATLMILNGVMTLQSLDCWYERVSGIEPVSGIELFYAENFGDEWMQNHFESMIITPGGGHS